MIRFALALCVACLAALPALAQDIRYPALFDVAGVAANDVLNIRAEPDSGAEILGSFAPKETGIEVLSLNDTGRWGLVNVDERSGWVSMAFLRPQFPGTGALPQTFVCFGTEPFWRLDATQNGTSAFGEVTDPPTEFATGPVIDARGRTDVMALTADGFVVVLRRNLCSDGMSDRAYGLSSDIVVNGEAVYSGCCTVSQK